MAVETIKPGYAYKSDTLTAAYIDNFMRLKGSIKQLKITATGAAQFILNREEDTKVAVIDGELLAGEVLDLKDLDAGVWSIGIKGTGTFRIWAYQ